MKREHRKSEAFICQGMSAKMAANGIRTHARTSSDILWHRDRSILKRSMTLSAIAALY